MKQFNLVICDDEFAICKGIRSLLEQNIPEVNVLEIYSDASFFLESDLVHKTHIVISDIRMKNIDGLTLVSRLKTVNPNCIVIFISGYQNFEYAQFAVNNRVASYLTKPIDPAELLKTVSNCVSQLKEQADRLENAYRAQAQQFSAFRSALQMIYAGLEGNLAGMPLADEYRDLLRAPYLIGELTLQPGDAPIPDSQQLITIGEACEEAFLCCFVFGDAQRIVYFLPLRSKSEEAYAAASGYLDTVREKLGNLCSLACTLRVEETDDIIRRFCHPSARVFREYRQLIANRDSVGIHELLKDVQKNLPVESLSELCGLIYDRYLKHTENPIALEIMAGVQNSRSRELLVDALNQLNMLLQVVPSRRGMAVDQIMEFIEENYATPLSLKVVADHFAISTEHVCRLFKQKTNVSFKQYLVSIRVEQAKKFLLSGKYNISETARLVGFENPSTFSATFKRHTGVTPHDFILKYTGNALPPRKDEPF